MKIIRNIILVGIGLVITFLVINFMILNTKYDDNLYDIIFFNTPDYKYVLIKDSIDFRKDYSVGNERDTFLIYTINGKQRLMIYSLTGLKDVDISKASFFRSDSFELIQLNPKQYFEYGPESISYETKIDSCIWIDSIKVVLHQNTIVDTLIRDSNNYTFKLKMSGLGITDSKFDYKFIIRPTQSHFDSELVFLKRNKRFYIIFSYSIKNEEDLIDIKDIIN